MKKFFIFTMTILLLTTLAAAIDHPVYTTPGEMYDILLSPAFSQDIQDVVELQFECLETFRLENTVNSETRTLLYAVNKNSMENSRNHVNKPEWLHSNTMSEITIRYDLEVLQYNSNPEVTRKRIDEYY